MSVENEADRLRSSRFDLGNDLLGPGREITIDHQNVILKNNPAIIAMTVPFEVPFVEIHIRGDVCSLVHLGPAGRWHSIERRGGFSLLEMLIVLALILIMSVMLYGSGSRSYQQKQKLACQKNLLNLHIALQLFANDHEGSFPVAPGARTAED